MNLQGCRVWETRIEQYVPTVADERWHDDA